MITERMEYLDPDAWIGYPFGGSDPEMVRAPKADPTDSGWAWESTPTRRGVCVGIIGDRVLLRESGGAHVTVAVPDSVLFCDPSTTLTVTTPPVVSFPVWLEFTMATPDGPAVVGRVRAEFDLSELPAELHACAVSVLESSGARIHDPVTRSLPILSITPWPPPKAPKLPPAPAPWWRRLVSWGAP